MNKKVYEVEILSAGQWFKLGWDHVWATRAEAAKDAKSCQSERNLKHRVVELEVSEETAALHQL